ncbi:MAG: cation diffusion facilitator family transporter [Pseudomonadota bacterium]
MTPRSEADREKRAVALSSVVAAVFLTGMKLAVGLWTGSLGLLSEAAHSGLDFVAAAITFFAVRAAGKPADPEHTYGHGKIESLSALFETFLLLVTCIWIIYEACRRLFFDEVHVDANIYGFVAIALSIVIDFSRSRALMKTAKKYRSQALEADALHFSTDIWSSLVVLFGLGMVWLAHRFDFPRLGYADSIAALIVAAIVIWICFRLGKRTLDDLLDAVPPDLVDRVRNASRVAGVAEVKQARLRRSGPTFFADITLAVGQDSPFSFAHRIAHEAEEAVRKILPEADVVVHVDPAGEAHDNTVGRIREIASKHGLQAHAIAVSSGEKSGSIEMHLEMDGGLRVAEAHEKVSGFEKELHDTLPRFPVITTHIEPVTDGVLDDAAAKPDDAQQVRDLLRGMSRENRTTLEAHDLQVRREDGKLVIVFHLVCDGSVSLAEAHTLTAKIEARLRQQIHDVGRIVIHTEPA